MLAVCEFFLSIVLHCNFKKFMFLLACMLIGVFVLVLVQVRFVKLLMMKTNCSSC